MDSVVLVASAKLIFKSGTTAVPGVDLLLDYSASSARINFYYGGQHGVLDLSYSHRTFVLGPDCKAIDLLSVAEATVTDISDVKIFKPDLTRNGTENLRLYF